MGKSKVVVVLDNMMSNNHPFVHFAFYWCIWIGE